MSIVNSSKPTTTFTGTSKASSAETWNTISTTWATETRTWDECVSIFDDISKPRALQGFTFDELGGYRIDELGGAMNDSSFMINTSKPS